MRAAVTGASSGIGAAIAEAFGGAGASVLVAHRESAEGAAAVAERIRASGGRASLQLVRAPSAAHANGEIEMHAGAELALELAAGSRADRLDHPAAVADHDPLLGFGLDPASLWVYGW